MITAALLGALLVLRAVVGTTTVGVRHRLAVIDRLLVPVGVAFVALFLVRLLDLWVGHA